MRSQKPRHETLGYTALSFLLTLFLIFFYIQNAFAAETYSLEDLYKIALERSERIKISEEDLFIAEMGKDKAMAALLPKLSAFWNYTDYTNDKYSSSGSVIQPNNSASWGLRLDQSFTLSGREVAGLGISKENIQRNRYDLHAVKEEYLLGVSVSYYEVLRAKKALDIAKANVVRLTKHRDAANIRLKVGEVTKTALLRAEAELSGAQSEEIKAKNALELAMAVLARLAGISRGYDIKETVDSRQHSVNSKGIEPLESLKQTALSERAELKSLGLQKKIGEEQVKYTRGSYWPTLSIEGVYQKKDEYPAISTLNKESAYGGIKISIPIFEGGLRAAEVKEAEAKFRQAALIYEDKKKTIYIEVENAYLDLITQKGITEKFEAQTAYATDNYKAVSKQFEFGLANSIDVMDANTLLVTAERQLSDARYNYQLSLLRLKRSAGMLLKTVNSTRPAVVTQKIEDK
ncbi:MAG: TolC family protein [Thermodesulfovibrionales bacterium]|nr:TolC family protein [Thermodesulfovibrionales bacterium]